MQEQRRFVEQSLGRTDVLDDQRLRQRAELCLLVVGEVPGAVHHDRGGNARRLLDLRDQFEAGHVGQVEIEHHAVELLEVECAQRLGTSRDRGHLDVAVADQIHHHRADGRIVLDHEQVLDRATDEAVQKIERLAE